MLNDILKNKNCIAFDNSEKKPQSSLLSVLAALYDNGNLYNENRDLSFNFDTLPTNSFITNPLEKEPLENEIPEEKTSEKDENIYDFALNWIAARTGFAKETLNIDMNLKYDLGLDSLKVAEFVFALGRKLSPDEIIGSPTLFSESTIREIIETMLADISEKYSDTDLRNDKKALVTTPGVIPDWIGTFEMELCDAPFFKYRKNERQIGIDVKGIKGSL